jgi:hypothetical protein
VSAIVFAGQGSGTHGNAFVGICGAVQMVSRKPERPLCRLGAFNLDVAATPTLLPDRLVALDNPATAELLRIPEGVPSGRAGIVTEVVASRERNYPLEIDDLAWRRFPVPLKFELANLARLQFPAIEL